MSFLTKKKVSLSTSEILDSYPPFCCGQDRIPSLPEASTIPGSIEGLASEALMMLMKFLMLFSY